MNADEIDAELAPLFHYLARVFALDALLAQASQEDRAHIEGAFEEVLKQTPVFMVAGSGMWRVKFERVEMSAHQNELGHLLN